MYACDRMTFMLFFIENHSGPARPCISEKAATLNADTQGAPEKKKTPNIPLKKEKKY